MQRVSREVYLLTLANIPDKQQKGGDDPLRMVINVPEFYTHYR
jgi:hypothetical protein